MTEQPSGSPLLVAEQGSFAIGGTVATRAGTFDMFRPGNPDGQTFHGDHAYVFYQKPVNARKFPLAFLHGAGQFGRCWQTTADGREGFQNIFLRRGYAVYLIDQPRRGGAGRSMVETVVKPTPDEQMWFNQFRIGHWPSYFPGVQFSRDPAALDQFFRSMTADTGPFDMGLISDTLAQMFDKIGPGVLLTHSQGGGPGWFTAIKSRNVRAIVSFEPGSNFVFPEGEVPDPIPGAGGALAGVGVPHADFEKLTRIPVVIYYGDYIPAEPVDRPGEDNWRVRLIMSRLWSDAVNARGGDVTVVHLPERGIRGNTHFPFSDTNNLEIADLVSEFLAAKRLD